MKVAQSDYKKIAIWWGRNDTFGSRRCKQPIKGYFSAGGNEKIFGCWFKFSPIPRVSQKIQGKGGQFTLGGCNK